MNIHDRAVKIALALTDRPDSRQIMDATTYRNQAWEKAGIQVSKSMDLYTTTPEAAKSCVESLHKVMMDNGKDHALYQYVEPSAGTGPFLEWLPDDTISMDILPRHPSVVRGEFLTYEPPKSDRLYCVVGAPPLGHYSDASVAFVNHALSFADMVGMIIRHHVGNRQINGTMQATMPLGKDAVRDLAGGHTPYTMEWRVWQA